jgi:hypothetical protein
MSQIQTDVGTLMVTKVAQVEIELMVCDDDPGHDNKDDDVERRGLCATTEVRISLPFLVGFFAFFPFLLHLW